MAHYACVCEELEGGFVSAGIRRRRRRNTINNEMSAKSSGSGIRPITRAKARGGPASTSNQSRLFAKTRIKL